MSECGIIKCTLISLWSLSEVSAHIHLWVKCDSQQIPSNHGEAEDGKQQWEALATEGRLFIQV